MQIKIKGILRIVIDSLVSMEIVIFPREEKRRRIFIEISEADMEKSEIYICKKDRYIR